MDRYGNTSAASIPLALDEAVRERAGAGRTAGDVGSVVGAGLTWASALIWLVSGRERSGVRMLRRLTRRRCQLFSVDFEACVSTILTRLWRLQKLGFFSPDEGRSPSEWGEGCTTRLRR